MLASLPSHTVHHYRFGEFTLDVRGRRVARSGKPIHMEPRAFDVLAHLVQNRHRVVTRSELLQTFWGDAAVVDGVVSQCIFTIRRALGIGRSEGIRTLPKVGFRFASLVELVGRPPVSTGDAQTLGASPGNQGPSSASTCA